MTDEEKQQYAIITIRNYLNRDLTDEEIISKYSIAIKLIINNIDSTDEHKNISSIAQGSQTISYNNNEDYILTNNIKKLLPCPFVRLF